MELGQYYEVNQKRVETLTDKDWRVAIYKCKEHLKWKLRKKTLSGVHAASLLGAEPIEHYVGVAYEKILLGEWEWKANHSLANQLIRIADSEISKEVEKASTEKSKSLKIHSSDIEAEFYNLVEPENEEKTHKFEDQLKTVEDAIQGDDDLGYLLEGVKEGKTRSEIAELLGIEPRQFDKLREKLITKARIHQLK